MRLALPLLLPLVFLASCAGTAADGDPSAMPGADVLRALPPLPPRDAPRLASTPFTTELAGHETTARGGNCVESDIDLFLEPPVGESAWAMYTLSPGGLEVISATVQFFMTNGQAFIALPDYAAGNWRVLVPELAGTFELPLDEDTYSAAGDLYVAILASNGDLIRVTGLQLTVDRPGWTLYDMDTPSTAGNGVDLFVQDGLPMMAYGGKDMSASYLYFARATLPLPTTPGDWRTMLVDFSFSPVDVGPPLAAALVAGRPAIAYTEDEEDLVLYARSTVAMPSETDDWVIVTAYDSAGNLGYQLGLAECVGTPRIAFRVPYESAMLATTTSSQPGETDWSIVNVTGDLIECWRPALTAINDHPIFAMNTDAVGGKGLHVGYALSHTPPGPDDWNMVPVHDWNNAGGCSSIAVQQIGPELRPVVSYVDDIWTGSLYVTRPLVSEPAGILDWARCPLDGRVCGTDVAVVDNRPFIIYCQYQDDQIKAAWATTPEFTDSADFDLHVLQEGVTTNVTSLAAAAVGDVPVIAYRDPLNHVLRFGFFVD